MWRMALPPRAAAAAGVEAINSTVFHSRRRQGQGRGGAHAPGGKSAFIFHHGHTDCDCSAITPTGAPPLELRRCRPGCLPPATQIKNNGTWWDLYNVSSFLHAEGHDVFIVSMPLKGVNAGPGANATADNKDHWWFLRIEQAREPALRYFVEPAVATVNYALALGYERVHMAGLSGGGWTTTVVSALDPRIRTSFPIAGSVPCAMRDPEVGPDREDFEQSCAPDPSVEAPQHPGRALYRACNYTCMYLLAGLEAERYQLQILHENDDCCYATHGRHDQMLAYEGPCALSWARGRSTATLPARRQTIRTTRCAPKTRRCGRRRCARRLALRRATHDGSRCRAIFCTTRAAHAPSQATPMPRGRSA